MRDGRVKAAWILQASGAARRPGLPTDGRRLARGQRLNELGASTKVFTFRGVVPRTRPGIAVLYDAGGRAGRPSRCVHGRTASQGDVYVCCNNLKRLPFSS